MNDIESRIRDAFRGHEDDAPAFDLADAPRIAGRTRRRQVLNVAGAGIAGLAVVVVVASGVGGMLRADRIPVDEQQPVPGTVDIALPIGYPVGEELPDLGDAPGPLAAVWMVPRGAGTAPEVVGLVAETGMFGTLPIDVIHDDASRRMNTQGWAPGDPESPDHVSVELSADGRRVAYLSPTAELIVLDLVSGESVSPLSESEIEIRPFAWWVDATHLFGLVDPGSDGDGWVWEPGTAPKLVDHYAFAEGFDLWLPPPGQGSGPLPWPDATECTSPTLLDSTGEYGEPTGNGYELEVPALCDVLGIIGSETLLGHWNSDRMPGDWNDPNDGNGTVVALDIRGIDSSFEDPSLRRVVASAGAPLRVTFAADLIGEALDADPIGDALDAGGGSSEPPSAASVAESGALAYSSEGVVYLANPDGTNPVPIQHDSAIHDGCPGKVWSVSPSWSPDGRHLAFRHISPESPPSEECGSSVVIADAAGNVVAEFPGQWPGWSPDSTRIAVLDQYAHQLVPPYLIGIYGIDGSREAQVAVTSTWVPDAERKPMKWMPDGASLIVNEYHDADVAEDRIWEVPVDGSTPRELPFPVPPGAPLAFSPDGSQVAYGADALVVGGSDGSGLRDVFADAPYQVAWSPGGDLIALVVTHWGDPYSSRLHLVDPVTGTETLLFDAEPTKGLYLLGFSPHGDRVLFANVEDRGSSGAATLWSVRVDGTDAHPVGAGPGLDSDDGAWRPV